MVFLQITDKEREHKDQVLRHQKGSTSLQWVHPQSEGMARGHVSDAAVQRVKVEEGASGNVAARGIKVNDTELGVGKGDEDRVELVGNEAGCPLCGVVGLEQCEMEVIWGK